MTGTSQLLLSQLHRSCTLLTCLLACLHSMCDPIAYSELKCNSK